MRFKLKIKEKLFNLACKTLGYERRGFEKKHVLKIKVSVDNDKFRAAIKESEEIFTKFYQKCGIYYKTILEMHDKATKQIKKQLSN